MARAGKPLEEMNAAIKLAKYKDWGRYKQLLPLAVEGMYNQIELLRRATFRRGN